MGSYLPTGRGEVMRNTLLIVIKKNVVKNQEKNEYICLANITYRENIN